MSETLIIENLGPIKHAELDLKRAMVFIGPQSSGKSVIAKVISICRESELFIKYINSPNREIEFETLFEKYGLEVFLNNLTYFHYDSVTYEISYQNSKAILNFKPTTEFYIADKDLEGFFNQNKNIKRDDVFTKASSQKDKVFSLINQISELPDGQERNEWFKQLENIIQKISDESNELTEPIRLLNLRDSKIIKSTKFSTYVPSERIFISIAAGSFLSLLNNNVSLPKNLLEFGELFETARNSLKIFKVDFLKIVYKYESNEDRIYLENGSYLNLKSGSSGLQSILPLIIVVEYWSKFTDLERTFVIEEPEQSLYPEAQNKLISYLADKCLYKNSESGTHNELIITTHSPYVLTSLNNLLFAHTVTKKHPELKEECEKVIPSASWIDPDEFNAYYVGDGTVRTIMNRETNLIEGNELDSASDVIMGDFDELMALYRQVHA